MNDQELFEDVIEDHKAEVSFKRERSRAGFICGMVGMVAGLVGISIGGAMALNNAPVVRYTVIDNVNGQVRPSFGAKDAPEHFGERIIRHYLTEYVEVCIRYVWQIDPDSDRRCKAMTAPQQQPYQDAWRKSQDFATKYGGVGGTGYTMVVRWGDIRERGKGEDGTLEYDVQYVRGEVLRNMPNATEHRGTARIVFAFHPEIEMTEQDRLRNEAGLIVFAFSAKDD